MRLRRFFALATVAWLVYGVGTFLAVLPEVSPGGYDRMAALKLIRTSTGFAVAAGLLAAYARLRPFRAGVTAALVTALLFSMAGGYLWLGLYYGLTTTLRGPDFFPMEPSELPRTGIDHTVVLLAWSATALWWLRSRKTAAVSTAGAASPGKQGATPEETGPEPERLEPRDHVYLRLDDSMELLQVSEILAILADGDYTTLVRDGGRNGLSDRSMKAWEAALPERNFARIHRSVIVNLSRVERLEDRPGGGKWVHLEGGRRVRMSRRYEARLRERLG